MSPQERVKTLRKQLGKVEESCRSDEVAEACEAIRDAIDALDIALEDEFGPRDAEMEDEE